MADVEIATIITQGVFASRPAAADALEYYATDTRRRYWSNGTTWSEQPPTGGVAIASAQGTGSADYSTSSTSFADVDGTNLIITPTLAQTGDILEITAVASMQADSSGANGALTFSVAGTDVGDTLGLAFVNSPTNVVNSTLIYYYTMPSGTQPAIKLRWKTAAGTAGMYNRSAVVRPRMSVKNLSRGGTL